MAILKVCSVYDSKAEAYNPPIFVPAVGLASRDFVDALTSDDSNMAKHKGDFDLYHVAEFDTDSASFDSIVPPRLILKGADIGGSNE